MSEEDLKKLMNRFQDIKTECNTPEKATELLQKEGIVDENGQPSIHFREP